MILLAVDTSSHQGGVALIKGDKCLVSKTQSIELSHSEKIISMIDEVFSSSKYKIQDIQGLVIAQGPGSFTGLRIGFTTVVGLARALNLKIATIPTLDFLAMNIQATNTYICSVVRARKNEVYAAIYQSEQFIPHLKSGYLVFKDEEFLDYLKSNFSDQPMILLGSGLETLREEIEKAFRERISCAPGYLWSQNPENLAHLGLTQFQKGEVFEHSEIEPLYLRENYYEKKTKN